MAVYNVHERLLRGVSAQRAAELIDGLASPADELWPHQAWPPLRFDRPLSPGAAGGHGPVRYTVEEYVPGIRIQFRFTGPRGFDGFHSFVRLDHPDGTVLRHVLVIRPRGPARLTWPLVFRWLHDALLEDSLDNAERAGTGSVDDPAGWSAYVRFLRGLARLRSTRGSDDRFVTRH